MTRDMAELLDRIEMQEENYAINPIDYVKPDIEFVKDLIEKDYNAS